MSFEVSILVRCYEYSSYTRNTINSILDTAQLNYTLIVSPQKLSAAENSNLLIDKATSEYIIIMDDDLEFIKPGWDVRLMSTLIDYPKIGCVAPRIFDRNMKEITHQSKVEKGRIVTGVKTSGALLAFKDIGIRYDEAYIKTQYDDTDFLYQFIKHGHIVAIDGNVDIKHMKDATPTSTPWAKQNAAYFCKKWKMNDWKYWGPKRFIK